MNKKQADRRPAGKPAEQGQGKHDPSKPGSGRRLPEVPEGSKTFGQRAGHPTGHPIDEQAPEPPTQGEGKDILDGDRSDRESGRPIQLGDDDESETFSSGQHGQADAERGLGGRPQKGREESRG